MIPTYLNIVIENSENDTCHRSPQFTTKTVNWILCSIKYNARQNHSSFSEYLLLYTDPMLGKMLFQNTKNKTKTRNNSCEKLHCSHYSVVN